MTSTRETEGEVVVHFHERGEAEQVLELCDMEGLDERILDTFRAALSQATKEATDAH